MGFLRSATPTAALHLLGRELHQARKEDSASLKAEELPSPEDADDGRSREASPEKPLEFSQGAVDNMGRPGPLLCGAGVRKLLRPKRDRSARSRRRRTDDEDPSFGSSSCASVAGSEDPDDSRSRHSRSREPSPDKAAETADTAERAGLFGAVARKLLRPARRGRRRSDEASDEHLASRSLCGSSTVSLAGSEDSQGSTRLDSRDSSRRPSHGSLATSVSSFACSFVDQESLPSLQEASVPELSLRSVARELLADDWQEGSLPRELFEVLGATEVEVSPWLPEDAAAQGALNFAKGSVVKTRNVSMRVPLPPVPLCPRSTRQSVVYRLAVEPPEDGEREGCIVIDSSWCSHDVPFGDKFIVQERIKLVPSAEGCEVLQAGRCHFLEPAGFLQSKINSSTIQGMKRTGLHLLTLLQRRATEIEQEAESLPVEPIPTTTSCLSSTSLTEVSSSRSSSGSPRSRSIAMAKRVFQGKLLCRTPRAAKAAQAAQALLHQLRRGSKAIGN